ncbi:MAG: glycosyltransferase family 2 protein [Candidatus Pacebacteria bacterium]|nr:glycosyltransferase family 2 protein [Candidatus Paceibacterota bacterium]
MQRNTKAHSISVVLPCLNEEETLQASIQKAFEGIKKTGLSGEVVIADNGSRDHSVEIAKKAGARIVEVKQRGYGAALMKGFEKAKGDILVMGDSDDTYDFREIPLLYAKFIEGYDLVSGNRLKGNIDPLAMPFIHRYIGVPVLTLILNLFFWTHIWDGHCGMRLLSRTAYEKLQLKSYGMEFASEMLMRASQEKLKMTEVPISYGQRHNKSYSKLNTFRDGFRHLLLIIKFALQ